MQLDELTLNDYRDLSEKFEEDVFDVYSFEASVERRNAIGGTSVRDGPSRVPARERDHRRQESSRVV